MKKRVFFKKGKQREFLEEVLQYLSIETCAKLSSCSERTIRDWRREKFSIDFSSLKKLCVKSGLPFPKSSNIEVRDRYWYVAKGASRGGITVFKKYGRIGGDPEKRKQKWFEWWEREGKYNKNSITQPLSVILPKKSKELAEFVGIVLGDGSISKRQITITLHSHDDREYSQFVIKLIKKLFKLKPGISYDTNSHVVNISISRIKLVHFFVHTLGLKIGNKVKQQVDIPFWIKQRRNFCISCIRGLVDTDGSVFTHRYQVKNKEYVYKKLQFTSHSEPLRMSVFQILQDLRLTVRLTKKYDIWIDSPKELEKYLSIVGSHNSKHLKRYKN